MGERPVDIAPINNPLESFQGQPVENAVDAINTFLYELYAKHPDDITIDKVEKRRHKEKMPAMPDPDLEYALSSSNRTLWEMTPVLYAALVAEFERRRSAAEAVNDVDARENI